MCRGINLQPSPAGRASQAGPETDATSALQSRVVSRPPLAMGAPPDPPPPSQSAHEWPIAKHIFRVTAPLNSQIAAC